MNFGWKSNLNISGLVKRCIHGLQITYNCMEQKHLLLMQKGKYLKTLIGQIKVFSNKSIDLFCTHNAFLSLSPYACVVNHILLQSSIISTLFHASHLLYLSTQIHPFIFKSTIHSFKKTYMYHTLLYLFFHFTHNAER